MEKSLMSKAAALCGSACVFVGSMSAMHLGFIGDLLVSVPLAAGTGLSLWYFWPGRRIATQEDIQELHKALDDIASGNNVDSKLVVETIQKATTKLDRITAECERIRAPNTKRRLQHLVALGRKIVEDLRVDPKDVYLAQTWANSYLDETIQLVRDYAELSSNGARSVTAQEQMAKFEDILDTLYENFQKLLDKMVENNISNFDVTMTVMEGRLNHEGM